MTESNNVREGSCRCGQVRMRLAAPPLVTMACHCKECQRMTASAFSLSAAIPTEGFAVTQGEPVHGGQPGTDLQHFHCPQCKSWLFTHIAGLDMFVNVRATMLDEPGDWATPFVECYISEKLPWAATPAQHSFPRFPAEEDWAGLTQAYQEQARRAATPPPRAG